MPLGNSGMGAIVHVSTGIPRTQKLINKDAFRGYAQTAVTVGSRAHRVCFLSELGRINANCALKRAYEYKDMRAKSKREFQFTLRLLVETGILDER